MIKVNDIHELNNYIRIYVNEALKPILACCRSSSANITIGDTNAIYLSGNGTPTNKLIASLILSSDAGNVAEIRDDGLYVPVSGGADTNFAENDLTATGDRTHDWDGNNYSQINVDEYTLGVDGTTYLQIANWSSTANNGDVLTIVDTATGEVAWQPASIGTAWDILGNIGTDPLINFLGTTDNVDVMFRRNNSLSGMLGSSSTGFGYQSLLFLDISVGFSNSAFGVTAGASIFDGVQNSAFGRSAMGGAVANSQSYNSAFGYLALWTNEGNLNSAFGVNAMRYNTTGSQNAAFGVNALLNNTTGFKMSAFGAGAFENNTTGQESVALGQDSGLNNTTGYYNNYVGVNAKGGANGIGNNIMGYYAGASLVGSTQYNVFIGQFAGFHASQKVTPVNTIAIGANTYTTADNQIVLGNSAHTQTNFWGELILNTLPSNDNTETNLLTVNSVTKNVEYRTVASIVALAGTVTAVSVATANGFAGSSSGGATPQLTLSTTVTGLLQGDGTAISGITNSSIVGQVLRVTGAATYAWGALDLADTDAITGNLPVANLNSGTGASNTTFWRGDATWTVPVVLGAVGASPNANGATLTGLTLNLEPASISFSGVVTPIAQTFNGAKTFVSDLIVNSATFGTGGDASAVKIGVNAMSSGTRNNSTAVGASALFSNNSSLGGNSGFGTSSLRSVTSGYNNTGLGFGAGYGITTGHDNTAVGIGAMGTGFISVGTVGITGSFNVAVGYNSLYYEKGSSQNTAIGYNALSGASLASVNGLNTAIGSNSGSALTTGSYNLIIGSNTGSSIATLSNYIILSDGQGNERMRFNNAAALSFDAGVDYGTATYVLTSNGNAAAPSWQAAASSGITGSLTSGRIPVANGASSVSDYSTLLYDGTDKITIGDSTIRGIGGGGPMRLSNPSGNFQFFDNAGAANTTVYFLTTAATGIVLTSLGRTIAAEDGTSTITLQDGTGKLMIGTGTAVAKTNILSTTEQLRLMYDASNYFSTTVDISGNTTFNATGTSPEFTFSDAVNGPINAYNATTWNGSSKFATEDAIRDKIESLSSGITRSVVNTSGSATMGSTVSIDYVYIVTGAHTMSLPAASGNTNRYTVKNTHAAAITVDTAGAENVEGAASVSIPAGLASDFISDGTNWWII